MSIYAKKWIGGILLLLLVIGLTTLVIGWKMQCVTDSMKMATPATGISLYQDLKITDAQKEKIQALDKEYQKQTLAYCEHHCSARMKIGKLLESGQPDSQELFRLQREVSDAYASSEEATLKHVMQVSEILTPEQKVLFLKKFGDHVQASCPLEFVH